MCYALLKTFERKHSLSFNNTVQYLCMMHHNNMHWIFSFACANLGCSPLCPLFYVVMQCGDEWYTPKEFVNVAGKSTLKDWKRAIRINGVMLR